MNGFSRAVVLLILGSGTALAGPPSGAISGHVTVAVDAAPAPYQYVYLVQCTNSTDTLCIRNYMLSAQTDASGYYSFDLNAASLPEGTYQLHMNGARFRADGLVVSGTNSPLFQLADIVNQVADITMPLNDIQVTGSAVCAGQRVAPNSTCAMEYTVKNITRRNLEIDAVVLIEWNAGSAIGTTRQQLGIIGLPIPQRVSLRPGQSQTLKFPVKVGNVPTGSYFFASLLTTLPGRPFDGNGQYFGWLVDVVATP